MPNAKLRERLDEARGAVKQLGKADPFTEPVSKGNKMMYRARFAGPRPGRRRSRLQGAEAQRHPLHRDQEPSRSAHH